MRNLKTATEQYTMQLILPLEDREEKEIAKRNLRPTFKPYDNKQARMILDLELFIPAHHVARVMDELFETMMEKLIADNYITMEQYFLDGTKMEADANKYSFVWKKSTLRFEAKLKENVQETLAHIHTLTEQEAGEYAAAHPDELPDQLEETAAMLEEKVENVTEQIAGAN